MGKLMKSLGQRLDGNKSIVSLLAARFFGIEAVNDYLDPSFVAVLQTVIDWIAAGAIAIHAKKGAFKKDTTIAPKVHK